MASEVGICNLALYRVGAERISSLTEANKRARLCKDIYEPMRDTVLRGNNWNFATGRVQLVRASTTPAFYYSYEYQLPADYLFCQGISTSTNLPTLGNVKYSIESTKLLTNESVVYLLYTKKITNPGLFDPSFVDALAQRIAMELAYPLVQSNSLKQELRDEYVRMLSPEASVNNAQEDTPEPMITDTWLNARQGGDIYDQVQ